jgi:hypothetical protein
MQLTVAAAADTGVRYNVLYSEGSYMTFESQDWKEVSKHKVYHSFLLGELHNLPSSITTLIRNIIEIPDFSDEEQNIGRLKLLECIRGALLNHVPPSTKWYLVRYLRNHNIDSMHVMARCGWDSKCESDKNEIFKVAQREKPNLYTQPDEWSPPILWGHSKKGPFTILEGNHRIVAWANETPRPNLKIPVYIGVSKEKCRLHIFDEF